jgi:hypothetical protein
VQVKAGHARQTLFPKGEADYAVPSVLKQLQVRNFKSTSVAAGASAAAVTTMATMAALVCSSCPLFPAAVITALTISLLGSHVVHALMVHLSHCMRMLVVSL